MSAQAGMWNFDGKPVDQFLLSKLGSAIEQYGPDGGSVYIDASIGVGMVYRAFHTTPESRFEHQPHILAGGNVITWDGRLDNSDELAPQFSEALRREKTDVATVGAAFGRWGTDCFRHIIGDWAAAIWRPKECELILACDFMAIRHVFYHLKKDRVWWSTDLTSLVLLSGDKFHIDDDYIAGYFANDPDGDLTPYREIREVPAGHFVRVRTGSASVERYWRFSPKSRIRYKTSAEYEEHFRQLFRQSVRRRLRSPSPILAELSGGLDSSSIVCMADDIIAKAGVQTARLDTLSYYDKTEPYGDDWTYFQKIEEKRGKVGAHIDVSKLASHPGSLDYPEFFSSPGYLAFGRQLEAERAALVHAGGYRAVLSGIGGDEFLGGIPDPRDQLADLIVQCRFVTLAKQLIAWSLVKRKPWIQLLGQASVHLLPPFLRQYCTKQAKVEPWIDKRFAKRTRIPIRLLDVSEHFGLWLPTRRSCIRDVVLFTNKLAKWEPPAMALEESRFPYLDQDLIEFVLSIPASQLLRPGERRSLMRRALVDIVPQEILSRSTKQFGARTPIVGLEKNLQQLRMAFDSPLTSSRGYINGGCFLHALQSARSGKRVHTIRLLKTISLEFWLRDLTARHLLESTTVLPVTNKDVRRTADNHSNHFR